MQARRHSRELGLVVGISTICVCLSLFQTVAFAITSPPGATYPLVHGYPPDYYWYLSLLQQGKEAQLFIQSRYTPEDFAPQMVNTFFVVWGFLLQWLPTPVIFFLGRFVWGVAQYAVAYIVARALLPTKNSRLLALVLFFFGVPFWWRDTTGWFHIFGEVWSELDPTVRNAFLPHHMAATVFTIGVFNFLSQAVKSQQKKYAPVAGLLAAAATLTNPGSAMILVLTLGIVCLIHIRQMKQWFGSVLIIVAPLAASLWYLNTLQHTVFPWTEFVRWERFVFYPVSGLDFLLTLGIPGVISCFVIPLLLAKRNVLWTCIVGWFIAPFIGLEILVKFLPVSNMRYLQSAVHIPAAIIASYGLWFIDKKLLSLRAKLLFRGVMVIAVSIVACGSLVASWAQQMRSVEQGKYNLLIQVPTVVVDGLHALSQTGEKHDVVVAPGWISTLIPAFTNKRVMTGHPTFTYQPDQKTTDLMTVYGFSDVTEIKKILDRYTVRYLWIESIHAPAPSFISALGLVKVYDNPGATVYKYVP